jgi:hypothetical protein
MNKKYNIINLKSTDYTMDYFFYIVILFLVIYIINIVIFQYTDENLKNNIDLKKIDNFVNLNTPMNNIDIKHNNDIKNNNDRSSDSIISSLQSENQELLQFKDILEEKLKTQSRNMFLSKNYIKIDDMSFDDENNFIITDIKNTHLPSSNLSGYKLIDSMADFDLILSNVSQFKNYYLPGQEVHTNSTFNINADKICYENDINLKKSHPDCMVCSVTGDDYKKHNSWKNTKTNIKEVCVYNPTAEANSGIPNHDDCKKMCNIP